MGGFFADDFAQNAHHIYMTQKMPIFLLPVLALLCCGAPETKEPGGEVSRVFPEYAKKNDLPPLTIDTHPGPTGAKQVLESDRNASEPVFEKEGRAGFDQKDSVSRAYLTGKFDPSKDDRFVLVGKKWGDKTMYLRSETYSAFEKMAEAAEKEGIRLKIISATRTFSQQKNIWESKWTGKTLVAGKSLPKSIPDPKKRAEKILEVSSMPGTSRHHWGTDIDLNNLSDGYFTKKNSSGAKIYAWLAEHAHEFGFCQPYSAGREHGYREEKWHWSYTPLSRPLTKLAGKQLTDAQISGFLGAETAVEIQAVKYYVLGINPDCK